MCFFRNVHLTKVKSGRMAMILSVRRLIIAFWITLASLLPHSSLFLRFGLEAGKAKTTAIVATTAVGGGTILVLAREGTVVKILEGLGIIRGARAPKPPIPSGDPATRVAEEAPQVVGSSRGTPRRIQRDASSISGMKNRIGGPAPKQLQFDTGKVPWAPPDVQPMPEEKISAVAERHAREFMPKDPKTAPEVLPSGHGIVETRVNVCKAAQHVKFLCEVKGLLEKVRSSNPDVQARITYARHRLKEKWSHVDLGFSFASCAAEGSVCDCAAILEKSLAACPER